MDGGLKLARWSGRNCAVAAIAMALSGCAGSGMDPSALSVTTARSSNPSIIDPATDGPTIAQSFQAGQTRTVGSLLSTRLVFDPASQTTAMQPPSASITKNQSGAYDAVLNGRAYSFAYADEKSSGDSWERIARDPKGNPVSSLTLWNAGIGKRAGLQTDENGQTFHKVLGYYLFDRSDPGQSTGRRERGHVVIGNPTDAQRMAAKTRTASYDGYYYANVMPATGVPMDQSMAVSGGMRLVADFDKQTISGQSSTFTVRDAGASNFNPQSSTIWLKDAAIKGNSFAGIMNSDNAWMNGTYSGQFFGGNAQEVGGVMSGAAANGVNEGFFTAVVMPSQ
jgi:hypothetical protein